MNPPIQGNEALEGECDYQSRGQRAKFGRVSMTTQISLHGLV